MRFYNTEINGINTGWKKASEIFYDSGVPLFYLQYRCTLLENSFMTKRAVDNRIRLNMIKERRDWPYFSVEG